MREIIERKVAEGCSFELPRLTPREVYVPALPKKAKAVIGPRRGGKTSLLFEVMRKRLEGGMAREAMLYFNFEDERLAELSSEQLDLIVEAYFRRHPEWRDRKQVLFLLDEIQVVPGWERFARRLLDTEKLELFFSGSSAKLLSREIATSMRGRAVEVLVLPFSFREYLRHLQREPDQPVGQLTKAAHSRLLSDFERYLVCGGYPEVLNPDMNPRDRESILHGYVDTVLFRDVVERYAVNHPIALRWLVRQLLANAGGGVSVNKFSRDLTSQGIPVAKDTLYALVGYLQDAFLLRLVSMESTSERQRMVNPRKVYPIDPSLIPLFDRTGRMNRGHLLETVVMLELERRGAEITYVKTGTGREIDFLARFPGGQQSLIQVCDDCQDADVLERELRVFEEAKEMHTLAKRLFLVGHESRRISVPKGVMVCSALSWLLNP